MRNILRYIIISLLLAVAYGAAGQTGDYEIDRVCVGAERYYRIDGEAGSTYNWLITDPFGAVTALPEETDTCTIVWNFPPGTYTLTNLQFGANGCDTTQLGTIIVFELPAASAGTDLTFCAPEPFTLDLATASDYSSLLWSTTGDGSFDDNTLLNPTYTFGPGDIANGGTTLTLTAYGLGNPGSCPPAEHTITITLNNLQATAAITHLKCFGDDDGEVAFTATGGTEPYTYTLETETNNTGLFTGLTAGTYSYIITDAAGCETEGTITITQPDELIASAGPLTATLCEGETLQLTGSHTGGTDPIASHLWIGTGAAMLDDETIENPLFTATADGSFTLIYMITDSNGCTAIASPEIIITVDPKLEPQFAQIGPLCQYSTAPGLPTTSQNGITGTWNPATISTDAPGVFTFTFTPDDGLCATTFNMEITIDEQVTPTFDPFGPYCQNSTAPDLPLISLNGITGTWNPPAINTAAPGTASYTFTPDDPEQCGVEVVIDITIDEEITPLFAQIGPLCQNSTPPVLPAASQNGITGTWNPPAISTAVAGTFTFNFTPDAGQCATGTSMDITIDLQVTPLFAQIGPLCQNSTPPDLPATSQNGITGTWNPPAISTAVAGTFTFNFTPDAGQCAIETSMDITIDLQVTPLFAQIGPLCQNSTPPDLPATSTNGITGTWDPPAINTAVAGPFTFTFTPDDGQCGTTTTMIIVIDEKVTPLFDPIGPLCLNAVAPVLPSTSLNGITGTWNPATIGTNTPGTFTHTFTPDAGLCANETSMQIVISDELIVTITHTDPTTPGGNDGTATATVTGGTPPYTYLWDDPLAQTTATATNLAAGTYTVTVTDANGCQGTATVILTDPGAPLAVTVTVDQQVSCFGGNDGQATATASGGVPPYSYLWSDPAAQTTATATGLAAGTYTVTVTDSQGAQATATVTITQPTELIASITPLTATLCEGETLVMNGHHTGGTEPATAHLWIGTGAAMLNDATLENPTFTAALPGTYTLFYMVTDANGCDAISATEAIITVEEITVPQFDPIGPFCLNAAAPALPSISTNGITGTWNPATISTAAVGTFTYTFTPDGGQCAVVTTLDITIDDQVTPLFAQIGPLCQNSTPPGLPATSQNGITGTWNPAAISTAVAGTFTFTFTPDDGQCGVAVDMTITVIEELTPTFTQIGPLCFNSTAPGLPAVSLEGIVGTWDPPAINTGVAGMVTHTFTPDDPNACYTQATMNIVITDELLVTVTHTDPTTPGGTDGTATATVTGGTPPYTYLWDDPLAQTTATATGLTAGTYTVLVTDINGCEGTASVTLTDPIPELVVTITDVQHVSCYGGNDGAATAAVTGGVPPYTYLWNDPAAQTTATATGLTAGTYTVTVTDAAGTVVTVTVVITQPDELAATVTHTDETYFGANDGTITITNPAGGSGAYEYSLDNITWQPGNVFTGLAPGSYPVYIRDANAPDCVILLQTEVIQPADALTADVDFTDVTCFGGSDGTITITNPQNGTAGYEYSIDGGLTWHGSGTFTGLAAGSYTVMLRDANHPENEATLAVITITQPDELTATVTHTDETYTGANDGTITVTNPAGGSGAYEYSLDGITWQPGNVFTGLAPGIYEVYIRDANAPDCVVLLQEEEIQPADALTADVDFTDVTCFGGSDGTITITNPQNGTAGYEYSIDGGLTWHGSGTFTGLLPGSYEVRLRDADHPENEVILTTVVIDEPQILSGIVFVTHETFPGLENGTITINNPAGGSGNYEYSLDRTNWQASNVFTGLAPGTYEVYIRDANAPDCYIMIKEVEVLPGGYLNASVLYSHITCFGADDGTISIINPMNGSGVYQYSIDGGATWQDDGLYTNLGPGTYVVMLRDANDHSNEVVLDTVVITEPAILAATVTFTHETHPGANDGTISITNPSGGSGNYEYSIDGMLTWHNDGIFTGLVPGTYEVYIRDAGHPDCFVQLGIIEIEAAQVLTATVEYTDITCHGSTDGTITISDPQNAFSGNYEYSINNGASWQTNGSYTGLAAGTYVVMIRDADIPANSAILATITIIEPGLLDAQVQHTNETTPGANDGTITVSNPVGGSGMYEYSINGFIWQTSGVFTGLTPGFYMVFIRDANHPDCVVNLGTLQILPAGEITAQVDHENVSCFGGNDGSITISNPTGGSGVYEYSINGGTSWQPDGYFGNLTAGSYTVMIRDANDPAVTYELGTVIIIQPDILHAQVTVTGETVPGANDGTISITNPSGGSGNYEYSIDGINWQISGLFENLAPGTYQAYIRDANAPDCFVLLQTVVVEPAGTLTATVNGSNVTCFGGSDGSITITNPAGGSGNYEYSLNGVNWQASNVFANLPAGSYTVRMRDANNPANQVTLTTIIISQPQVLYADVDWTNETLPGANDGTITISNPTGGSGNYEFSIDGNNWQASGLFENLAPGAYDVYIRDANAPDCFLMLQTVIIQPAGALTAEVDRENVSCFGGNDGSITVSNPSGGSGNYEYSIDGINWQTNGFFGNLIAGTYTVRMRDADDPANEVTLAIITLTQPQILAATVTHDDETLPGANDGAIHVTNPTGGSGAYEFSIDGINWQTSGEFLNLAPGDYEVYIRDANQPDCYRMLETVTILPAGALTAELTHTDVTCFGGDDGTITVINPSGGSGNYEYSIDGTNWQSDPTFGGLIAGDYTVWMRDADDPANSSVIGSVTIGQPDVLHADVNWTNETLIGANDGTITITNPTGGSGVYQYSIDGGLTWHDDGNFTNLAPGIYEVYIRDANAPDCYRLLQTVEILPAGALSAQLSHSDVTCFGGNDGSITIINPTGGSGDYEFSIDGTNWQADPHFGGLAAGTYTVWMRDANDPAQTRNLGTVTIGEPELLSAVPVALPVSCAGLNDGVIEFTMMTGGYGTYQFSISDGASWQPAPVFSNLAPGIYRTWIRDAAYQDCEVFLAEITITEPDPITAQADTTPTTCGEDNGSIVVTASGGTGNLQFMLQGAGGWQNEPEFENLAAGTYTILIRDEAGCSISLTGVTVGAVPPPQIVNLDIHNAFNGVPDGSVTIIATGTEPLEYSLDGVNWQSSNTFTNLDVGHYTAWVRDADGCIVTEEFDILNTVIGEVQISTENVTYCMNLPVIIPVDSRDFYEISSFILELEFDPSIISFNGLLDKNINLAGGEFSFSITGNILQIRFSIFNGSATVPSGQQLFSLSFDALAPGNTALTWNWLQCIIFSSGNDQLPGIYVDGSAEILPSPEIFTLGDGTYCTGDSLTLMAGTATGELLDYYWTGPGGKYHTGQYWNMGNALTNYSGSYTVVATNSYLCKAEAELEVEVFTSPVIHIGYADTICYGRPVLLDPGSGYTSYLWHDGSTYQSMVAIEAGDYWVQVEDEHGCRGMDAVTLVPCNIELLVPNAFTPNGDGLNDIFRPIFRGWEPSNYSMHIYSKWGQLLYESYDPGEGWDGTVNGVLAPPDSFVYVIAFEAPSYVTRLSSSPVTGSVTLIR